LGASDDTGDSAFFLTAALGKAAGSGISFIDSYETTNAQSVHELSGLSQRTTLGGGIGLGGEKAIIIGRTFTGDAAGVGLTFGQPVVGTLQGIYSLPVWSERPAPLDFDLSTSGLSGGMCSN